ncbi:VOC family protein [Sphingobacterium suaedae]|uniref:VOC family protein n=1 Tax=Sphingobacterium suaedae TaxID=1686402 RepID=A0ABW5KGE7_9SPHI
METPTYKIGQFYWADLTVENPSAVKEFYKQVVGWQDVPVPMNDAQGAYEDYIMAIDNQTVGGGLCHRRGVNSQIPPQWIMYVQVADVQQSLEDVLQYGGSLVQESRKADGSLYYVIVKDPLGCVFGLGKME